MKEIRELRRLSQKDFAGLVGVSPSYVSDVESGNAGPSVDMVLGVATKLSFVDIRWLLTGEGAIVRSIEFPPSYEVNLWEIAIMRAVRQARETGLDLTFEQAISVYAIQLYVDTALAYKGLLEHGQLSTEQIINKLWDAYGMKGSPTRIGSP